MPYESDLALQPSPACSLSLRSELFKPSRIQLPPGGSLCPYRCFSSLSLLVSYCIKGSDQKAPSGRELAAPQGGD